jgi:hypothetical protein
MKRAAAMVAAASMLGCMGPAPSPFACGPSEWIAATDAPAITLRSSGVVTWDASAPPGEPIVVDGTLVAARDGPVTTLEVETSAGVLRLEVGLALPRLGALPLGEPVRVTLADGIVLADADGRIQTAVVSRRERSEVMTGSVTFRQSYAECAGSTMAGGCWRVVAAPLVDVVSGASVVRIPPGALWRIPNDQEPVVEIEIVRSVRAPEEGDSLDLPSPLCAESSAQEIAAIVRHLR